VPRPKAAATCGTRSGHGRGEGLHGPRSLLDEKNVAYLEIDVSCDAGTLAEIRAAAAQTTFPQIVIDGVAIGGFTELYALDLAGKLDALLY
jgi:glutaredoxin 3